jgi:proprotein convertase subtilisin/kexin type 5
MILKIFRTKIILAVALLALLFAPTEIISPRETCAPECGGNSNFNCADFDEVDSSPDRCYSCAAGYMGGTGKVDGIGANCRSGECPKGCSSCINGWDNQSCYLCSFGYYDSVGDPTTATPCKRCHNNCLSCEGPNEDDCRICAFGFFDSLSNPYTKGSCEECDSKCTVCDGAADNCVDGCCALGFSREGLKSKGNECVLECNPPAKFQDSGVGTCAPECGGNSSNDCADFFSSTSSPDKCYSCASGHVGGTGIRDSKGATCSPGKCNEACAACKNSNTSTECYLCSYGFFDSEANPARATPCVKCHPTCLSCTGPSADQCLFCAPGLFDSLNNPYMPGTCDECDSKCSTCSLTRDNCGAGCCADGFHTDGTTGKCNIGCKDVQDDSNLFSCAPECGGNNENNCADFNEPVSSPNKCYSCASGYVGGTGFIDGIGAPCVAGTCNDACAACLNSTTKDKCYLCSYGFYDSEMDPSKATPCEPCHETCLSCNGPNADNCFFCNSGFFDSLSNPYLPGTCDQCDSKCSTCRDTADNCGKGCCADGFRKNDNFECLVGCVESTDDNVEVGKCSDRCGGDSEYDCSDYDKPYSSAENCYSCATGFVGGTGKVDGVGALCARGICDEACAACKTGDNASECYLCSYGFFDSENDPSIATPCEPCHESCLSCTGPGRDQCLFCASGYFDSLSNPYLPGTCDPCDSSCSTCRDTYDNCGDRCCSYGFHHNGKSGKCQVGCDENTVIVDPAGDGSTGETNVCSSSNLNLSLTLALIMVLAFFF